MALLAWLRRLVVSIGIGGTSYAIMLGIMVLSIVYDRELEPIITFAFNTGRSIVTALDSLVSGSHWGRCGQPPARAGQHDPRGAVDPGHHHRHHRRRHSLQLGAGRHPHRPAAHRDRLTSVPATVVLAVALFSFNALVPDAYAALLRFADWVWQVSLNGLSASGDTVPGARKLTNAARQGFSGHHYVIMALCSMVASFSSTRSSHC